MSDPAKENDIRTGDDGEGIEYEGCSTAECHAGKAGWSELTRETDE